jgi:hypothetical protein
LVRLSEIFWVLPVFLGLLFAYRNILGWRNIFSAFLGLALMGLVILGTNNWVYGDPLTTGYTVGVHASVAEETQTPLETISSAGSPLPALPFGFHPRAVLRNLWNYGVFLYPWMTIPAFLGFIVLAVRRFEKNRAWKAWTGVSILVTVSLVLFYGSWTIVDNPDPTLVTIGNSHVRYWLPLFVLAAPFMAYLFTFLWRRFGAVQKAVWQKLLRALLLLLVMAGLVASVRLVFFGHDGILASRAAMNSFIGKRTGVLAMTEANSVIIIDRADKYLFPFRRVIVPLRSEETYEAIPALVKAGPTYYFGITFPQSDLDYLNHEKFPSLSDMKLKIELVQTMSEESLYRISSETKSL